MDAKSKRKLLEQLNRDARILADRFGLRYQAIQAERANVKSRFGICYSDGLIKIRLRHAVTGKPLKYSSLVSTLCHELAHLRHFHHGETFQLYYQRILEYARSAGIYRPGPSKGLRRPAPAPVTAKPDPPRQLELFG